MLALMGLHMLAAVVSRGVKPPVAPVADSVDIVMIFGFFACFCTLVVLMYQHKMRTRIPLLVVCLATLSIYGFLSGVWGLGFSLAALSVSEFTRQNASKLRRYRKLLDARSKPLALDDSESRIARMFGSQ